GDAAAPLAIINPGSTDGGRVAARQPFRHTAEALWLREHGFAVLVPMRRGRGGSEGSSAEEAATTEFCEGLEDAVEDLASAIAYGLALPFVRHCPVLLVGQSRGGFLSVVYAGRHPHQVAGVVNFAGGWTGEHWNGAFNTKTMRDAGRGARAPQLWLYGKRDSY